MHRSPGAGLIRRQRGEIGEIEASDFPHPARGRTYLRIEPHEPEGLATDAAKSLLHRHRNALSLSDVKISLAGQGFNRGEIVATVVKAPKGLAEMTSHFTTISSNFNDLSTPRRCAGVSSPAQNRDLQAEDHGHGQQGQNWEPHSTRPSAARNRVLASFPAGGRYHRAPPASGHPSAFPGAPCQGSRRLCGLRDPAGSARLGRSVVTQATPLSGYTRTLSGDWLASVALHRGRGDRGLSIAVSPTVQG